MRRRFITRKKNGHHWIVGHKVVDEYGTPIRPQDFSRIPRVDLFAEDGTPLYVIIDDGIQRMDGYNDPAEA